MCDVRRRLTDRVEAIEDLRARLAAQPDRWVYLQDMLHTLGIDRGRVQVIPEYDILYSPRCVAMWLRRVRKART